MNTSNTPDKIYVEIRHPFGNEFTEMLGFENWGNSDDIEYIRKDALLEWLEQIKADPMIPMNIDKIIDKLNSL